MEPITGVISSNNIAWEFVDDEICPECEKFVDEFYNCPECGGASLPSLNVDTDGEGERICMECNETFEVDEDELFDMYCEHEEKLLGDWKKNSEGLWEPDTTKEFAAIVTSSTFNCVQVVWSKYTREVRAMCSPCFPGQADLDSGAGNILCYDLPDYLVQH